jgi:hypothetical protein
MADIDDRLDFESNANIKERIGDENIIFSDTVTKIATDKLFGKSQERKMLITNQAIYNIKGDNEIKRRIRIEDIRGITVSRASDQFIVHCNQHEYDYLYVSKSRKKIIKVLQNLYEAVSGKDLLFCQKDDKDISKYVTGKKERRKSVNLFKIGESELSSIKDYIENDDSNAQEEEPEPAPKKAPKPAKVSQADTSVKVVSSKGKGVPPPPPPPPPPPQMKTVASSSKPASKPVDLAAELEAKKNNLQHVEVKDYVSPALQNPEESAAAQTGNSMMAAIIAKRNQMKKVGGGGAAPTGGPKPSKPPGMSGPKPTSSQAPKPMGGAPKPVTSTGSTGAPSNSFKPPTSSPAFKPPTSSAVHKPPTSTSSAASKPPAKMGGGGNNAFAAKMAALQARMGGGGGGGGGYSSSSAASSAPKSNEPSKPIVELCQGNTKRMDINKVIGNLEKENKKKASKTSSKPVEVKVVASKGKGIPPPPPPPPPPPKI